MDGTVEIVETVGKNPAYFTNTTPETPSAAITRIQLVEKHPELASAHCTEGSQQNHLTNQSVSV